EDIEQDILKFEWPDLQLDLAEIELENNNFSYLVNNETGKKGVFNSNAIVLTNINLQAEDIKLKDKIAHLQLDDASFKEVSGIHLKNLQLSLDATDKQLNISNLNTKLNNNVIKGDLKLNYPSLSEFIKMPEQSRVTLNLPSFIVSLKDLFLLQPNLKKNEDLKTLSEKRITGNIK